MLDAARWIKDGKIYRIGHNYDSTMPLFGKRVFTLRIPGSGPFGENRLVYHDEFVATEIGQVGTQFDALSASSWVSPATSPKCAGTTVM